MRWRRFGRKAVSTIIAGIIVLTLLLTALSTMIFITQQYNTYQSILNTMSQKDTERFSENFAVVYPGIIPSNQSITCVGGKCNQYILALSNNGPVEVQLARIYLQNENLTSVCMKICTFDPSNTTAPYKFQGSESLIDQGESSHFIAFWLPATQTLSNATDANSIDLVTTNGRVFAFQWAIPLGVAIPSELRLDAGPLRIIYDPNLVAFTETGTTTPGPNGCANRYPSTTPCYQPGWYGTFPSGPVTFYVRISDIGGAPVTLLDTSYLLAEGAPASGQNQSTSTVQFYIVNPMPGWSSGCLATYFASSYFDPQVWDSVGACPTPTSIQAYNYLTGSCNLSNKCYELPNATLGVPGQQTYILFSAQTPGGTLANALQPLFNYFLYLELSYTYTSPVTRLTYEYSTSLPLIAIST